MPLRSLLSAFLILLLAVPLATIFRPAPTHAAVSSWQNGVTINPTSTTDFSGAPFQQSVRNAAAIGANYITLVVPVHQSNIKSTDVGAGYDTPSDSSLIQGITYSHSLGLHVMVVFHDDPYDGNWRAYINPVDRNAWFLAYGNLITHYASIARSTGVEQLCLGTEMIDMTSATVNATNTQHWTALIASVRSLYSGSVIYDANWGGGSLDEVSQLAFWPQLTYIGISGYMELRSSQSPDIASMKHDWGWYDKYEFQPLFQKYGKQIIFSEIGYRSVTGAHLAPWNSYMGGASDQTEQANDYEAMFEYWNTVPYVVGAHWWEWSSNPNAGGNGDTDYTPQNKLAQAVMAKWFGASVSQPAFTSSASATSAVVGQPVTLGVTVSQTASASVSNVLTDLEVYDANNKQVFQTAFSGGSYAKGDSKQYSASWTPGTTGSYVVRVGVFTGDWSHLYSWNNSAATVAVSSTPVIAPPTPTPSPSPTPAPAPGSSQLNIWWPSNGSVVGGVQPFKAQLSGYDVSQYSMYWQVDGGQLNLMADNQQGYPHKESGVNLSSWNWRGSGPYVITFVAKDLKGSVLAQASTSISVSN